MLRKHIVVDIIVFSLFISVYAAENVEKYNRKIENDLQDQFLELSKRMQVLEQRDKEQQTEINKLKVRGNEQQAEIKNLKAEVLAYKQQTAVLRHLLGRVTDVPEGNDNDKDVLDAEGSATNGHLMNSAEHPTKDKEDDGQRVRRHTNGMNIAFFAALDKHVLHSGVGQNIVFDHVITNDGSAYSNTLGAFIAPVDGTYVFSTDIMSYGTQTEHYNLAKNGQIVRRMYVRAAESPYVSTGVTAVLKLHASDNVEIKTAEGDGSVHGDYYSSFAGFLLYRDEGLQVIGK